ncbi:uncharacterized protein LOC124857001 [Scomber scombrus]|uniref:Uncharacterized protein LOC124857001 n=1 Tax=Scomber scombrus TaxID=13677 RepID=A0AAV1PW16_SCOSC
MWHYHLKCPNCAKTLTGCGIFKTVRKVLDLDGWYYMATEYLECRYCRKKVAGWSECVRMQLDFVHQQLFPAVLTYRLSCDRKVLGLMKGRTLRISVSRLHAFLTEQHTAEWMRRGNHYLHTCYMLEVPGVKMPPPPVLPNLEPVPSSSWLLDTYAKQSFTRIKELRAKVTSTFGSILKMDSTKTGTRKLAVADAGSAQWMTSVGNELGQVLMSVLTSAEGYRLQDMARGLQERYQRAKRDPPEVLYVDRGCCSRDGGTCAAAALFPAWPQLYVRLDIWHFRRRLAAGVTSESHVLYPDLMQRLLACIFEWDPKDVALLRRAKEADQSRGRNQLTIKEMARHCRRRTRGAQETERLLDETIQAFMGVTDTMSIPLLDRDRMEAIWATQRKHVNCIQDPPAVQLYARTGKLTKDGVTLPVYCCARGSTSLESFHMHLNRFIPDTTASSCHFQMYLLEGLTQWNEDRAQEAVGKAKSRTKSYSGQEVHTLNQLAQHFYGFPLVESYTNPLPYTGELIGISYLYDQNGRTLQDFPDDPDEPIGTEGHEEEEGEEEEGELDVEEVVDEGFDELSFNSLYPSQPPQHVPFSQLTPETSSGNQEEAVSKSTVSVDADGAPGYQHVVRLAQSLVERCGNGYITNAEVEEIVGLWEKLPDADKSPVEYVAVSGIESMERCIASGGSGPSMWPDASRLVEAIFVQLCILHPGSKRVLGCLVTRWKLVLRDYNAIRNVVNTHPALKTRTSLQLFVVNQTTLSQWHKKRTSAQERTTLIATVVHMQAEESQPVPSTSMYEARSPQEGEEDQSIGGPSCAFPAPNPIVSANAAATVTTSTSLATTLPATITSVAAHATIICIAAPAATTSLDGHTPKSTMFHRKKMMALQVEAEKRGQTLTFRAPSVTRCRTCGLRKIKETGHRRIRKANGEILHYCPTAAGGQSPEEWMASFN